MCVTRVSNACETNDGEADMQKEWWVMRQKQIQRETDRQIDIQTNGWTDRETEAKTHTNKYTDITQIIQ